MNLLDKRPLSVVILAMLCGLVFYAYNNDHRTSALVLVIAAGAFAIIFAVSLIIKHTRLLFLSLSLSLIFTLLVSTLYFDMWFNVYDRFAGESVHITGMASQIEHNGYGDLRVTVKTESINGEPHSNYKLMMNITQTEGERLAVGAVLSFDCEIGEFENFSTAFNSKGYYASLGYSGVCKYVKNISVSEYTDGGIEEHLTLWRDLLSRRAMLLSDQESGSFLSGLLLGEKKYLDNKVEADFTRAGISHILALSGMHFVILGLGIEKLLSLLNVNKKCQKAVIIVFAIAYTALTGCSPSVLRSGIMLVVSSLLYLFCGSRDTLTNMFISCALICFATPYSVFSMSLWLSVFSTLGICAMLEFKKESESKNIFVKLLNIVKESFTATFFAVGAIMWLMMLLFSGISNMMIPANLLLGWISDLYLYVGSLTLIFGEILPVGKLLIPMFRLIKYFAALCASPRLAYVSTDFQAVALLTVIFSVLYFVFLAFKIKHKRSFFCILFVIFASVFVLSTYMTSSIYNTDMVLSRNDDSSDRLIIVSDSEITMIDSSKYSEGSAYSAVEGLVSGKLLYLDRYIITHYSKQLDDMLDIFLTEIKTDTVYLPYPENEREKDIADVILDETVNKFKVKIKFYRNGATIDCGNFDFTRNYNTPYGDDSITTSYSLKNQYEHILYLSSGMLEEERAALANGLIDECTTVIFGSHGKGYKKSIKFDICDYDIKQIVLCSDNLVFEQASYIFYKDIGCRIDHKAGCVRLISGD